MLVSRRSAVGWLTGLPLAALYSVASSSAPRVPQFAAPQPFADDHVASLARDLAAKPFFEATVDLPEELANIGHDQYRDIRFDPQKRIWRREALPFNFDAFHSGFLYTAPVDVFVVDAGQARQLLYSPELFDFGPNLVPPPKQTALPFAGVRLRYPLNGRGVWDEFAFAETAGLPELPGRQPFGGPILSHDFVEAALMRRAGWAVYMLPGLQGSYEESPPTLIDLARRDRRWAQGNLQHVAVLPTKGLCWVSRMHLLQGIMAYLASPLWLLLIGAGLILSLQAQFATPEYFPQGFVLFPQWPVFDPERALRLFALTLAVLFLPKVLGISLALMDRRVRVGCGGSRRILAGVAVETLLSALIAPVMMLIHSRFVIDILCGRDSGWSAQNRDDRGYPWRFVARCHLWHVVAGITLGGAAAAVSVHTLLWHSWCCRRPSHGRPPSRGRAPLPAGWGYS